MKTRIAMVVCLVVGGVSLLYAHDLFLKLDNYLLDPHTSVGVVVLNGTFTIAANIDHFHEIRGPASG